MAFDTTILANKIEGLKEAYQNGKFGDALVGALNTGNGLMQQRIFQQNEDVLGNSFGPYVGKKQKVKPILSTNKTLNKRTKAIAGLSLTSYQIKRAKAGRQISKKDLEFTGATRRSIETVVENEQAAALEFNNLKAARIAHGQEQQIANLRNGLPGTTRGVAAIKIFGLNKFEKEQVNEQGLELITQILKPK